MAARRPFWKWRRWKSIGFCLWPPSTCIWNLKLKFHRKLDLCSGNHVVYRQMDGRTDGWTDKVNPVYPPSNFVGRGYNKFHKTSILSSKIFCEMGLDVHCPSAWPYVKLLPGGYANIKASCIWGCRNNNKQGGVWNGMGKIIWSMGCIHLVTCLHHPCIYESILMEKRV